MATSVKVTTFKRRDLVPLTQVSVPSGSNGFITYQFEVKEINPQHGVCFLVKVIQQSGRTDLDIGFSVMDDDNYHRWLLRQPNSAFIIAPKFNFGTLTFMPSNIGRYHAVLDNRYSVFTGKEIQFNIYETWIEEKEVEIQKPKEKVEAPKQKVGLLQRFRNRLRSSRVLGVIGLLIVVQLLSAALAIGIALILHYTLGIDYSDTMSYITTAVGGSSVAVLVYVYFVLTGKSLIQPSPVS